MSYIDTLISNCETAKQFKDKPKQEFQIRNLSKLPNIKNAVYIIEEEDGNPNDTFQAFLTYKSQKERKCPKPNYASSILYVGSSTKNLKNRLKQHIEKAPKDTYALNLECWFKSNYIITIKVYDVEPAVLQIIEDAISYDLKPAFGKQGGNGK